MSDAESTVIFQHTSVLVAPVVELLLHKPGGLYVDATFGGGGHTKALLAADPTCRVIACDWDKDALAINVSMVQEQFPGRLDTVWGNFSHLSYLLKDKGIGPVDGILADFGTSQYQIAHKAGFSFREDRELDMRMSTSHGELTAYELVNFTSERELADIIYRYGEDHASRKIAREICLARKHKRITSTVQLAALIERIIPRRGKGIHPATKTFQALRIVVNRELENIETLLKTAASLLFPGGRLACISFHSLEDRLVKTYIREHPAEWKAITKKVVVADAAELSRNPSSRSAKLRVAEKVDSAKVS